MLLQALRQAEGEEEEEEAQAEEEEEEEKEIFRAVARAAGRPSYCLFRSM